MIIVNVIIIIIKYYFVYFVFFKCKLPFLFRKYLKYNFHYMILFNTIHKLRCGEMFVIFRIVFFFTELSNGAFTVYPL